MESNPGMSCCTAASECGFLKMHRVSEVVFARKIKKVKYVFQKNLMSVYNINTGDVLLFKRPAEPLHNWFACLFLTRRIVRAEEGLVLGARSRGVGRPPFPLSLYRGALLLPFWVTHPCCCHLLSCPLCKPCLWTPIVSQMLPPVRSLPDPGACGRTVGSCAV